MPGVGASAVPAGGFALRFRADPGLEFLDVPGDCGSLIMMQKIRLSCGLRYVARDQKLTSERTT